MTLKELAYKHRAQGNKTNRITFNKIKSSGIFDIYPRMEGYSIEYIKKILRRITAKHFKCKNCGKINREKFKGNITCGLKCQAELSSKRMSGNDNPSIKYYDKIFTEEYKERHSKLLKDKISNGKFTPCVTNSWANSKVNLKLFGISFRSGWEAYFYIFMTSNNYKLHYEKIRIKYYDSIQKKTRNYITDFVDNENKIIYEIKPDGCKDTINVREKEAAAKKWCKENGYVFKFISNDFFKQNYNKIYLENINEDVSKIEKSMKQFEGE